MGSLSGKRTLPPLTWVLILALCAVVYATRERLVIAVWPVVAPASYARAMPEDYDYRLANAAGQDPTQLPALLARAQAGDRYAMYHYGEIYNPLSFTGETSVRKDAAVSILWYRPKPWRWMTRARNGILDIFI